MRRLLIAALFLSGCTVVLAPANQASSPPPAPTQQPATEASNDTLRAMFNDLMRPAITAAYGPVKAGCMIDQLNRTMSIADIRDEVLYMSRYKKPSDKYWSLSDAAAANCSN